MAMCLSLESLQKSGARHVQWCLLEAWCLSSGNKKARTAGYGLGGILFLEAYERQERARRMRAIFAACSGELSVAVRMA